MTSCNRTTAAWLNLFKALTSVSTLLMFRLALCKDAWRCTRSFLMALQAKRSRASSFLLSKTCANSPCVGNAHVDKKGRCKSNLAELALELIRADAGALRHLLVVEGGVQ